MKKAGRAILRGFTTGALPTVKPTRKWAFTRAGASPPISSLPSPPVCERRDGFLSSQRRGIALSTRHPAVSRLEGDPVVSGSQPLKQVRDRNRSGMQGEHGPCNDSRYVAAVLSGFLTP